MTLSNFLIVAFGGALGSVLRYAVSLPTTRLMGSAFPWGTLLVNVGGCFAIGLLWGLAERIPLHHTTHLLVFAGILGGFTTFSTYGLETVNLLVDGRAVRAFAYVAASNLVGLLLAYLGFQLAAALAAALGGVR